MARESKFKKILVTGGAGYVGIPVVQLLLSKGFEVRVFDNLSWGGNVLLPFLGNSKFDFMRGDIRKRQELAPAIEGIDAIIHLAAIVGFPACRKFPELSRQTNVGGTKNLISLTNGKIPIIFASTGSTYGKIIEQFCTETTPLNPLSHYGKQKAKAEQLVKKNKKFIIYRFATAFGAAPRFRLDLLINDFTFRAVVEKTLMVYEGDFMRTFIHVRDMASSFLFALKNYRKMEGEIYNVGDESLNISKEEIAKLLLNNLDFHLHFIQDGHDIDQRDYVVDYSKIKKLGYKTKIGLQEGIEELIKACGIIELKSPYGNV